jgi:hypothetical protein
MLINFLLSLAIGYELQKLIQFNFFFRLRCIVSDYYPNIQTKIKSVDFKELLKISLMDLSYSIVLLLCLFTINLYFSASIYLLSIIQNLIFKTIKNKTIRKIAYSIDIILSITLLLLSITNSIFYHLDGIQFIKQLF